MFLYLAIVFFILAAIAGVFGFGTVAVEFAAVGRLFFGVFLILFLLSLLVGLGVLTIGSAAVGV